MNRYTVRFGSLLLVSSLLWACGPDSDPGDPSLNPDPGACGPFGCREPEPGFAKFSLGHADSVRWIGVDGCRDLDLRIGEDEENRRKFVGTVTRTADCDPQSQQGSYEVAYRQLTTELIGWSVEAAFRPMDVHAAKRLLGACTFETRPEPIAVIGYWWDAERLSTAEGQYRDFIGDHVLASNLIPFDDDGYERLGEELIDGVPTIAFENDRATVWMINDGSNKHRPLRAVGSDYDVMFKDWDVPFEVEVPDDRRSLSEVCVLE
jgi:hypothetical protein